MPFQIVLISGSVASGKTTLVRELAKAFPYERIHVLKTKDLLVDLALKRLGAPLLPERRALQEFGDRLLK